MHFALEVEEIRQAICASASTGTLAALVQSCSAFFLPAARELYRDSSYSQLLHMLWCYCDRPASGDAEELTMLAKTALTRFLLYASLIHSLTLSGEWTKSFRNPGMNPNPTKAFKRLLSLLVHITAVMGIRPPLANLRKLMINPSDPFPMTGILLLLSGPLDSLDSFCIHLDSKLEVHDIEDLLTILPDRAPKLRHFYVYGAGTTTSLLATAIQGAMRALYKVEDFGGGAFCLEHNALRWLDKAPNLKCLRLWIPPSTNKNVQLEIEAFTSLPPTLMSLQEIQMYNIPLSFVETFLDQQAISSMKSIQVWLDQATSPLSNEDFHTMLLSIGRFTHLRELTMSIEPDTTVDSSFWSQLEPLFACRMLKQCRLAIGIPGSVIPPIESSASVTDGLLISMAKAWSDLEELSVEWTHKLDSCAEHGPTLHSIFSLMTLCPQLWFIHLDTLSSSDEGLPELDPAWTPRPLQLQVHHTAMHAQEDVAIFLVKLTSSLVVRGLYDSNLDPTAEVESQWKAIVAGMRTIRRFLDVQKHHESSTIGSRYGVDFASWTWPPGTNDSVATGTLGWDVPGGWNTWGAGMIPASP